MAYTLQAFVADLDTLAPFTGRFPTIPLSQGKGIVPLTTSVRAAEGRVPYLPLTDGVTELPTRVAELCVELSIQGKVAYLEAELFGGTGLQAAVLADRGQIVGGPIIEANAINIALRFLGVIAIGVRDEFDALHLDAFRSTDDWPASLSSREEAASRGVAADKAR